MSTVEKFKDGFKFEFGCIRSLCMVYAAPSLSRHFKFWTKAFLRFDSNGSSICYALALWFQWYALHTESLHANHFEMRIAFFSQFLKQWKDRNDPKFVNLEQI